SIQTTPFLQRPPEREPFADRFDLCLVELEQCDAEKLVELIRRITPAMKNGGTLLTVIRESGPMESAERFETALVEALRGTTPAARVEQVRAIPASRLRAWSYRTFAHLGAAAHQRPSLGLPGLALFAVPLALFTLGLNMFAAAGFGARGQASSLHV